MSICFIIACKVYKQYISYISFYISNILDFYPDATILLIDNNSLYKDVFELFRDIPNIKILENLDNCKFEIGAYRVGTKYILENNLHFDYYVCTQDTFVLVNKLDFEELKRKGIKTATIQTFPFTLFNNWHVKTLSDIGLYDPNEVLEGCSCMSYICDHESLVRINIYLKDIIITERLESEYSERYMGKILKHLNNDNLYVINPKNVSYCTNSIDPTSEESKNIPNCYFIKRCQQKTEKTPEYT